jgi:predicted nucleotidyltransferase
VASDIIAGMDSSSIIDRASQACADVFCGTPVFLAYAYGSRIEGGATPTSDLDIGYYLATPGSLPLAEEMILADRLSRRLGMDVDLRNLGPAPLEWRARVLERGRRLHCINETARVAIERELMVRWFDEQPRINRLHATRLASFAAEGLAAGPTR